MTEQQYPPDAPLVSVWVTVTHRKYVLECLPSFLANCSYPNYELLICHDGHPDTLALLEDAEAPNKQIWRGPQLIGGKYKELRERSSGDYYYSIQDDWMYCADVGPMIRDAITLMANTKEVSMVRTTSHSPVFLDLVNPIFRLFTTRIGPVVFGLGLADTQTVMHKRLFDKFPDLWPVDMDFYESDGHWQERIREGGQDAAVMLRYWGCTYHAGIVGARGWKTLENRLNEREGMILRKYGMFGERPLASLYTTWMNEEQRCEFLYPHYILGRRTLVPNGIPLSAQPLLGKPEAERVV